MKLSPEQQLELYENQLNILGWMVDNDCFTVTFEGFSPDEEALFRRYFLPDWDKVDDYKIYYQQMTKEDPQITEKAWRLLRDFLRFNPYLAEPDVLFPQTLPQTKEKLAAMREKLHEAPDEEKVVFLKPYLTICIEEQEAGNISDWERDGLGMLFQGVGYMVVATLLSLEGKGWNYWKLPEAQSFAIDEIFEIAANLELPIPAEELDRTVKWNHLKELVKTL